VRRPLHPSLAVLAGLFLATGTLHAQESDTAPSATELAQEAKSDKDFKAPEGMPKEAKGDAQVIDRAGTQLPLDTTFDLSTGEKVRFGDLLRPGRPTILQFVYFRCPSLCTVTLTSMVDLIRDMKLEIGDDYDVISVSINPQETANLARLKKEAYLGELGVPGAAKGWTFLTGSRQQIDGLAKAAGFGFRFDTETREYAHGAAIFALTPEGVISRTIPGSFWRPNTVRLSLIEATDGGIGSPLDHIVLYCYQFNPGTGTYTAQVMNIVRLVSLITMVLLGSMMGTFFYREHLERRKREAATAAETAVGTTTPQRAAEAAAAATTGGVA
jgi:protein SCO1